MKLVLGVTVHQLTSIRQVRTKLSLMHYLGITSLNEPECVAVMEKEDALFSVFFKT